MLRLEPVNVLRSGILRISRDFGSFKVLGLGVPGSGFAVPCQRHPHRSSSRTYGWLSKLWPLFGYPKYSGPYYNRDPKRDHNFDNQPYLLKVASWPLSRPSGQRWRITATHNKSPNSNNHNHTSKKSSKKKQLQK